MITYKYLRKQKLEPAFSCPALKSPLTIITPPPAVRTFHQLHLLPDEPLRLGVGGAALVAHGATGGLPARDGAAPHLHTHG